MEGVDVNFKELGKSIKSAIKDMTTDTKGQKSPVVNKAIAQNLIKHYNAALIDPSFKNIKKLRTNFRQKILQGIEKEIPEVTEAVNKIYYAMSESMGKAVKQNLGTRAFDRWKHANKYWGETAAEYEQSILKKIFNGGDVIPENMEKFILKNSPNKADIANLKILHKNLTSQGRENVRSSIIDWAANKSITNGIVDVNKFKDTLKSQKPVIDIFFRNTKEAKSRRELQDFIHLMDLTKTAQTNDKTMSLMQAGTTMLPLGGFSAMGLLTGTIPELLGSVALAGSFGKLFQSPMFIDSMLKLRLARKGSSKFEKEMGDVRQALQNIYQATVNDQDEGLPQDNSSIGAFSSP